MEKQNFKDRMHEHEGMMDMMDRSRRDAVDRKSAVEYYAGHKERRMQEREDAGMIQEDPRQVANLPQEVMMKPYHRNGDYIPEVLNDTIGGIDRQISYDGEKRKENFYPKKV